MSYENKFQNSEILNKRIENNTSSDFCLPSEIKELWKELISEDIVDVFSEYIDNYKLFIPIVQTSLQILTNICQNEIDQKLSNVSELLNLSSNSSGKLKLNTKLYLIFQEFATSVFSMTTKTSLLISEFKSQLQKR